VPAKALGVFVQKPVSSLTICFHQDFGSGVVACVVTSDLCTNSSSATPSRGILYHRYALDENGLIVTAKIVPPTSQNQKRI